MRWEIIYKGTVFVAEEMGIELKRSALSPNIRERMDHSCAILDKEGKIVAQAEHIPVHLGSFRIGVKNLIDLIKKEKIVLEEGDMIIINDPYIAGTHLNDIMVFAPVYWKNEIAGYVVNKAHQVDVGGPSPGSINPRATTIYEEGIIIPAVKLIKKGLLDEDVVKIMSSNFKTPDVTMGDLHAQLASNRTGINRVRDLFQKYGVKQVHLAWIESMKHATNLILSEIKNWPKGKFEDEDYLEWDDELIPIHASISVSEKEISIDFTGTSPQVNAPLNAVFGVTYSAVAFAIRSMMKGDIPTNEGLYRVLNVKAPPNSLVNPVSPFPVAGGNLETSQRVADVMFKVLSHILPERVSSAGSGTMMSLIMGGPREEGGFWSYYETIGGGTGGRPGKSGVSGVHVNMTNTLNTPIEVAERTYPLLYTSYAIRSGSGGKGEYNGGDSIIRSFKSRKPSRVSILGERFKLKPWPLQGGEPGLPGKVTINRDTGNSENLPSKFTAELNSNDEVVIETPGGAGWGKSKK